MDIEKQTATEAGASGGELSSHPRSLVYAESGVRTGRDFGNMMSALMSDLIAGRITPGVGNAVCNAGGKLLKVAELQARFGQTSKSGPDKVLQLAD